MIHGNFCNALMMKAWNLSKFIEIVLCIYILLNQRIKDTFFPWNVSYDVSQVIPLDKLGNYMYIPSLCARLDAGTGSAFVVHLYIGRLWITIATQDVWEKTVAYKRTYGKSHNIEVQSVCTCIIVMMLHFLSNDEALNHLCNIIMVRERPENILHRIPTYQCKYIVSRSL